MMSWKMNILREEESGPEYFLHKSFTSTMNEKGAERDWEDVVQLSYFEREICIKTTGCNLKTSKNMK